MLAVVAALLAFIAVGGAIAVLTNGVGGTLERRLSNLGKVEEKQAIGNVLRSDTGTFPFLRGIVSGGWSQRARQDLAQAGVALKVSEYLLLRLAIAAILAVVAFLVLGSSALAFILALPVFIIGYMLPAWYMALRRSRRIEKIDFQLPEGLALVSNSLRSGFAFTQAVELACKQIEPPLVQELNQFLRDTSLGQPTDEALQEMVERSGSYDLEMMVSAILIQRTAGGNLSEVLDNVAGTIRERQRLQGEIRALTASQRLTGLVLSVYPVALGLLLVALAPSIYKVLVTEEAGRVLLVIALILQIMGVVTIRRILRLEV